MAQLSLDTRLEAIPRDAMVLIHGPPMTGKYDLMLQTLTGAFDSVIIISTKNPAPRVISDYHAYDRTVTPDNIGIVDAASHHDLVDTIAETQRIKLVNSPENLTQIGVKFTELFDQFHAQDAGEQVGVGLYALSQLVMYSGVQSVFKFLQVLTGHLRSAGWFGVAVLDATPADEPATDTLREHFDGVVETRENAEGRRQYRLRGFNGPSEWASF